LVARFLAAWERRVRPWPRHEVLRNAGNTESCAPSVRTSRIPQYLHDSSSARRSPPLSTFRPARGPARRAARHAEAMNAQAWVANRGGIARREDLRHAGFSRGDLARAP